MKVARKLAKHLFCLFAIFLLCILQMVAYGAKQKESLSKEHKEMYEQSLMYIDNGYVEAALFMAKELQKSSQQSDVDSHWELKAITIIQEAFQKSENYDSSLYYCYAGMELAELRQDNFELARFKNECGKNYLLASKPNLAIELIQESVEAFKLMDSTDYVNYALGNLAIAYGMIDSLNKCEDILREISSMDKQSSYISHNQIATHINLAVVYIQQKHFQEALHVIEKIEHFKDNERYADRIALIKGQAYATLDVDSATFYLEKALNHASIQGNMPLYEIISLEFAELNYQLKRYKEASAHYKRHIFTRDSIKKVLDKQYIESLGALYKINQKEREIDNLKKINWLIKQRTILLIIVLGTIICMVIILLLWAKSRLDYAKNTQNSLKRQLKSKKEVILENALKYTQLFEVTTKSLNQLKGTISKGIDKTDNQETYQLMSEEINNLKSIINNQLFFENQIDISNAEFIHYLQRKSADLSEKELRLCVLILTGLSSKEISSLINISDRTINNARSIIRKKLDIPQHQQIQSYLEEQYKQCFLK